MTMTVTLAWRCDCECDCKCDCDCNCDCDCASECDYCRFSFNLAKRKQREQRNNLSLIWTRPSTGRCTWQRALHVASSTLQAASSAARDNLQLKVASRKFRKKTAGIDRFPNRRFSLRLNLNKNAVQCVVLWDHVLLDTWNISWICQRYEKTGERERERGRETARLTN